MIKSNKQTKQLKRFKAKNNKIQVPFLLSKSANFACFYFGTLPLKTLCDVNFCLGILAAQLRDTGGVCLAMTATAHAKENIKIKQMCDMRKDTVIIRRSPVTDNHMYLKIKRPPSLNGFIGNSDPEVPSTLDLLCRVVLDKYISDIVSCVKPKIVMIFVQSFQELDAINNYLSINLENHLHGKPKTWIVNHSDVGKITKRELNKKIDCGEISLFCTTSVMLCGIDMPQVDIVVIVRPFSHLGSNIQAGGRGGRLQSDGFKKLVAVYMFYNATDIRETAKFISKPVRLFFKKEMCSRKMLHNYFFGNSENSFLVNESWCCDSHSLH